jgi:hypothetical protein
MWCASCFQGAEENPAQSRVNYIDSSGIGELVSAFTTVRNQGGELKRST